MLRRPNAGTTEIMSTLRCSRYRVPSLPVSWWQSGTLLALLLLVVGFLSATWADELGETFADPVPLRRVLIPPERVPAELERVRQGILVQLPRKEFEARVRSAAQAGALRKQPPRLIQARYRATLQEDSTLVGTGQWEIHNPAVVPGVLPLQPFNLALKKVRLKKAQLDLADAILGDLDGKTLGLLVDAPGEQSAFLDWSVRGEADNGGLRFDLQVPASVAASLELNLPDDRAVTVDSSTCLLSGPHPAETPDRRTWRIDFGNRSQLSLLVRQPVRPGQPAPLLFAQLHNRQTLGPDLLQAEFEFKLEGTPSSRREFRFSYDAVLRPYEVDVANLETWEPMPPQPPAGTDTLVVKLREPLRDGSIRIRCLAPLRADKAWTCPTMRLEDALDRGETIQLRVPPDVQLENWQSGHFRFTDPAVVDEKGEQMLTLARQGVGDRGSAPRPSARVKIQEADVRARQRIWWRLGPTSSALTTDITFTVARGRLFELPVLLPPNWQVDQVKLEPAGLLRTYHVVKEKGQSRLMVDLQEALGPRSNPAQLTLQLQPEKPEPGSPAVRMLTLPQVVPLKSYLREGILAITVDPVYEAEVQTSMTAAAAEDKGPWGRELPTYCYRTQGQAIEAAVTIRSRSPRVQASYRNEVMIASGRAQMVMRLFLQPDVGHPDTMDLCLSAPVVDKSLIWKIKRGGNRIREVQRLPAGEIESWLGLLGSRTPFQTAGLMLAPSAQWTCFRITLARPLREQLLLEASFELTGQTSARPGTGAADRPVRERHWQVPLPTIRGTESLDGDVALYLGGTELVRVESSGLRPGGGSFRLNAAPPWRMFRYDHLPVTLTLHEQLPLADRSAEAMADRAHLTTLVDRNGRLLHHYGFQLWNWRQQTVPVWLPAGARPVAARVDDRWVPRLATQTAPDGKVGVALPVSAGPVLHRLELIYVMDGPSWNLWMRLEAPVQESSGLVSARPWEPELPVRPTAFRHTWRLPPGIVPLLDQRFRQLPGGRRGHDDLTEAKAWLQLPPVLTSFLPSAPSSHWMDQQQQVIEAAKTAFHQSQQSGKEKHLGDLLDQVIFKELQGQVVLVVDAQALNEMGWEPATSLQGPVATEGDPNRKPGATWEDLGLVFQPCRSALLLTTRRQLDIWQAAGQGVSLGPSIQEAIAEAAAHGQDTSDRFRSLVDWLPGKDAAGLGPSGWPAGILPASLASDCTEWETHASAVPEEAFLMIRADIMPGLGQALAMLLLLAAWPLRRLSRSLRLGLLLAVLALCGLGLLWLPGALWPLAWWPTLAGLGLAVVWYLRSVVQPRPRSAVKPSMAATGFLILAWAAGWTGQAAAPAPVTVFLLPGPKNAPDEQTVLVPPDLLEQLQTLSRRGMKPGRKAVLISANYDGTVAGLTAAIKAEFQIYAAAEEPTPLVLPLGASIQLKEALLDGAPAHLQYPRGTPLQPAEGYTLEVKGRGFHTLLLQFAVDVGGKGNDRDLNFAIPELAQSRLTLDFPAGGKYLQAVGYRGLHQVSPVAGEAGPSASRSKRLEVDLGRVSHLHVRWREEGKPSPLATVLVREAYLWNLRPDGSNLATVFQFTVSKGLVTKLPVDLPENLEVRGVGVSRLPNDTSEESGPRLHQWTLEKTGNQRRLLLEFQRPVAGGVQVMLDLVPRQPFGPSLELPLPAPVGTRPAEGVGKDSFLAYRVEGLTVQGVKSHGIVHMEGQPFVDFWRSARLTDPGPQTHVYRFRRTAGVRPVLELTLQPLPVHTQAIQEATWTVGPRRADLHLKAKFQAHDHNLILVEWEVPKALTLGEVSGANIRSWSQTGNRLQVWLQHSQVTNLLELVGWLPLAEVKPAGPQGKSAPGLAARRLRLAPLRLLGMPSATYLRIVTGDDLSVEPERVDHLWLWPESQANKRPLNYVTSRSSYEGTFLVHKREAGCEVQMLMLAEVVERYLTFHAVLDFQARPDEVPALTVQLRQWSGGKVRLEAFGTTYKPEPTAEETTQTWVIPVPPNSAGRYQVRLSGSQPLKPAMEIPMPEVSVAGVSRWKQWIAVAGRELRTAESRGLRAVAQPLPALRSWPAEAERVRRAGAAWEVQAKNWHLNLLPPTAAGSVPPVQVFLCDRSAAVVDGRRWIHQAAYWLYHEAGRDLTLILPERTRVLAVALDGAEVVPLQPEPNRLWLPLSGSAGIHHLRLSWVFDDGAEPFERPHLEGLKLEGGSEFPTLWTVRTPSGYQLTSSLAVAETSSAAAHELHRAETQLQLSTLLAERMRGSGDEAARLQLLAAQERFYRACHFARYQTDATPALESQRKELLGQNRQLAQTHGFDALRSQAEQQVHDQPAGSETVPGADRLARTRGDLLPKQGIATYWLVPTPDAALPLTLVDLNERQTRQAVFASWLLAGTLLGGWVLSFFTRVVAWIKFFWPEQMASLGLVAWGIFGLNWVSIFLILVGIGGRFFVLTEGVIRRLHRAKPAQAAEGSGLVAS
jgi:hypothetical protein